MKHEASLMSLVCEALVCITASITTVGAASYCISLWHFKSRTWGLSLIVKCRQLQQRCSWVNNFEEKGNHKDMGIKLKAVLEAWLQRGRRNEKGFFFFFCTSVK